MAILMCTHNGARFLRDQLTSFTKQSYSNWHLYVYDDGSSDNTQEIVEEYSRHINNKVFFKSVQYGNFAKNFLSSVFNTDGSYDFYAFSDQDDIWEQEKLSRAVEYLCQRPNTQPNLYCSSTMLVDSIGKSIGLSPLFRKPPTFQNAIVQSIAGGNTMVFNKAARNIIAKAGADIDVVSHDWWIYQLISGVGGRITYDPDPSLLYRQHGNNLIGSNTGIWAKASRIKMLFSGRFKKLNDRNISALMRFRDLLTNENQKILDQFIELRKQGLIKRVLMFYKLGIYRQTFLGNIGLLAGIIFGKI